MQHEASKHVRHLLAILEILMKMQPCYIQTYCITT